MRDISIIICMLIINLSMDSQINDLTWTHKSVQPDLVQQFTLKWRNTRKYYVFRYTAKQLQSILVPYINDLNENLIIVIWWLNPTLLTCQWLSLVVYYMVPLSIDIASIIVKRFQQCFWNARRIRPQVLQKRFEWRTFKIGSQTLAIDMQGLKKINVHYTRLKIRTKKTIIWRTHLLYKENNSYADSRNLVTKTL